MNRQSRMAVACRRCRMRKTKCDRSYPKCSTCRRLNVECFTGQHYSPDVAEDLPRGYIENLEREVRALELRAAKLVAGALEQNAPPQTETPSSNAGPSLSVVSPDGPMATTSEAGSGTSRRLMPQWNLLSEAPPGASSYQRTSLFERMVSSSLIADNSDPRRLETGASRLGLKLSLPSLDILPRMLASEPETFDAYLDHYVEHIQSALPFLDSQDICSTLRVAREGQVRDASREPVLCMALCIGALCAARLSPSFRTLEHARTLSLFASEGLQLSIHKEDLNTARLLILFIIHSLMHPSGGGTWHIRGLAVRICITLGLHHEESLRDLEREASVEQRRLVFWTVYAFDRWISLALGRPFGIQDVDITTEESIISAVNPLIARLTVQQLPQEDYASSGHSNQLFYWIHRVSKVKSSNKVLSKSDSEEVSAVLDSVELKQQDFCGLLLLQTLSWIICLPHLSMDESGIALSSRLSGLYLDHLSQARAQQPVLFWLWGYSAFHSACMHIFIQSLSGGTSPSQQAASTPGTVSRAVSLLDTISTDFPGLKRYAELLRAMKRSTSEEVTGQARSSVDLAFLQGTHTYNICMAALAMQSMTSLR